VIIGSVLGSDQPAFTEHIEVVVIFRWNTRHVMSTSGGDVGLFKWLKAEVLWQKVSDIWCACLVSNRALAGIPLV